MTGLTAPDITRSGDRHAHRIDGDHDLFRRADPSQPVGSGRVPAMNIASPRTRWYTCATDRLAEVPHFVERHAWHMIFSPDPLSIKLGLAFYSDQEVARAYLHRRRVVALACMLRRIEAGGRQGARAERRLDRWPFLVTDDQVDDAQRLVRREVAIERGRLVLTPRAFSGSVADLLPVTFLLLLFVQACLVGAGFLTVLLGLGTAGFMVLNALSWGWRQGYREAMLQSIQAEHADRATEERVRLDASASCDLKVKIPPAVEGQGHLYVLQFSTGWIKVGQTNSPRRRLAEHRRDAEVYGVNITRIWVSRPHRGFLRTEAALIEACLAAKGRRMKREYFTDIAFDVAVRFADTIAGRLPTVAASEVAR